MRTVLGLSKTSTSIGWVLVDGQDVACDPLDHDAFDVADAGFVGPAVTARRALAIATATGYTVDCVRVTSSDPVHTNAVSLRKALREFGIDHVVSVPLMEATRAWATGIGHANGDKKTAVCILNREAATLAVIDTRSGAIKTATTKSRDSAGRIDWLSRALGRNGSQPESLYLIGSRSELDAIAGPLAEGLSVPVVATHDVQLGLALGAAFSDLKQANDTAAEARSGFASHARTLTVVPALAVASLFTLSSADGPVHMGESISQQAATPPAANAVENPTDAASVAPLIFAPSPAAAAPPAPEQRARASIPEPEPAETGVAADPVAATLPAQETMVAAPPSPEVQPVQHMPEAQPTAVPGSAPVAPGPAAPPPAAPVPLPSDTVPPPPLDPLEDKLNPLFSELP